MLNGKSVLIGITGGIAAYKIAGLCSSLVKLNADTNVMMTENACRFISPLTFETLTNSKCMTDTFDRMFEFDVKHISAAKKADVLLIAPATANVIAKLHTVLPTICLQQPLWHADVRKSLLPP